MNKVDEMLKTIEKYGMKAQGKKELMKYLYGERTTQRGMILAKCYDCMGFYSDGRVDCLMPTCPLYPLMPYHKGEKYSKGKTSGKILTEEHKAKMRAGKLSKHAKV